MTSFKTMSYAVLLFYALLITVTLSTPSASLGRPASPLSARASVEPLGEIFGNPANTWGGASLTNPPAGAYVATGKFVVPKVTGEQGAVAWWVGIGTDVFLQAGVAAVLAETVEYFVVYEWWPNPSVYPTGIEVAPGDEISVTVYLPVCGGNGVVFIQNLTKNQSISQSVIPPSVKPTQSLSAAWIAEKPAGTGFPPGFPDFGSVVFTGCTVLAQSGNPQGKCPGANLETAGIEGSEVVEVQLNGKNWTQSIINNNNEVTINYIG